MRVVRVVSAIKQGLEMEGALSKSSLHFFCAKPLAPFTLYPFGAFAGRNNTQLIVYRGAIVGFRKLA